MEKHKYNYGIIGNCSYLALIDDKANIGWLCWPRFDSSFVFGALLMMKRGESFPLDQNQKIVVALRLIHLTLIF